MSNPDKHTDSWSQADIQKYLNGELSAREMHQLEQAALDDPFLADALEGLGSAPAAEVAQDMETLRTRLQHRVDQKRKQIVPPVWRVAAAIILLLGLGFMAWYGLIHPTPPAPANSTAQNPASSTAQNATEDKAVAKKATADSATTAVTRPSATTAAAPPVAPLADRKTASHSALARRTHRPASPRGTADSTRDVAGWSYKAAAQPSAPPEAKSEHLVATPRHDSAEYQSQYRSNALAAAKVGNQAITLALSGRVLDLRNNPLPNAYVYVNNGSNNYTTTTNMDGFFKLRFHPEDSTQTLNVALVGYRQASIGLNTLTPDPYGTTSNVIRLKEIGTSIDEVVVSGYGSKRRETRAALASGSNEFLDTGWIRATPVMGRPAYLLYLQTSKKSLALDTSIRGAEIISFMVGQKGELTDFRIEGSLSPAHDAGLIRVVSEGPAWRLVRGKTTRAVVSLLFP
jgi:hypothetical protein